MEKYYDHNIYQDMYGGNTQKERVQNAVKKHGLRGAKKMYPGILSQHPSYFKGKKAKAKAKAKTKAKTKKVKQPIGLKNYWDCIKNKRESGLNFIEAKKKCKKKVEQPKGLKSYWDCIKDKRESGLNFMEAKNKCKGSQKKKPTYEEMLKYFGPQPKKPTYSEILKYFEKQMNKKKVNVDEVMKQIEYFPEIMKQIEYFPEEMKQLEYFPEHPMKEVKKKGMKGRLDIVKKQGKYLEHIMEEAKRNEKVARKKLGYVEEINMTEEELMAEAKRTFEENILRMYIIYGIYLADLDNENDEFVLKYIPRNKRGEAFFQQTRIYDASSEDMKKYYEYMLKNDKEIKSKIIRWYKDKIAPVHNANDIFKIMLNEKLFIKNIPQLKIMFGI